MIKLRFETLDHIRKTKRFKTLAGARKAAQGWVGKDAEIGTGYAISADGVVKVMAEGCTLQDLFSDSKIGPAGEEFWHVVQWYSDEQGVYSMQIGDKYYNSEAEALDACRAVEAAGYYNLGIEGWRYGADGHPVRIEPKPPAKTTTEADEEIPF